MGCYPYKSKDGQVSGFICTGNQKRKLCQYKDCKKPHTALCDYPEDKGKTCDMRLCDIHRIKQAKPDTDFCPAHATLLTKERGL